VGLGGAEGRVTDKRTAASGKRGGSGAAEDGRPEVHLINDPQAVRAVVEAVEYGWLPDVYVTGGLLAHLTRVSGDPESAPAGAPLPVRADVMTPATLALLLARHTLTYRNREVEDEDGAKSKQKVEATPGGRVLSAVLAARYWPSVRPLYGIVGAPVLRPDGSLLQRAGYDDATGLYLAPKVAVPHVPDKPSPDEVAEARSFITDKLLLNFPFVSPADKANHIGLLVASILRPYLQTLTPYGLISATTQSSGKTLLAEIIGHTFGYKTLIWRRGDDAEVQKAITAALREPAAVLLWDNLPEGSVVDSAVLAALITMPTWSDRLLGTSSNFEAPNNRLWLATGNNIRLGGDMATRTVLIRLDPNDPHPEERDQSEFGIPKLNEWLREPGNRITVLRHLLVLVADWVANDAPRSGHQMRQFTSWAQATGGFLDHHGIPGFLGNLADVRDADEGDAEWTAFLGRWFEMFKSTRTSAAALRRSADPALSNGEPIDEWRGAFLTDDNGRLPSTKSLGRWLTGHIGRWHGGQFVLRSEVDKATKSRWYAVERRDG
jgi:hypothetical protein